MFRGQNVIKETGCLQVKKGASICMYDYIMPPGGRLINQNNGNNH